MNDRENEYQTLEKHETGHRVVRRHPQLTSTQIYIVRRPRILPVDNRGAANQSTQSRIAV